MKALRLLLICLIVVAFICPTQASASWRIPLVETFTNTSCGPCASANPVTHSFINDHGPQLALNVQFHVNWPSASDPFYLANTTDNNGRRTYYGINAVPDLVTDGVNAPEPASYTGLKSLVGNELAAPSPFDLTVGTTIVGTDITVDVEVTATDVVPGSGLELHIAVVEPYVFTDPPGADNGERHFYCTMRDMLPSHAGQTLTITNGQTVNFSEMGTLDPSWVDCYAVAWVEDTSDKSIMQSASSLPVPDFSFFFGAQENVAIVPMILHTFDATLQNRGAQSDTYDIHVDWDVPAGWGGGVCEGGTCHSIGDNDFTVRLDAGLEELVTIDIEPFGSFGQGMCTVTATSQGNPSLDWVKTFKVITPMVPILVVDDDGGDSYETYYHNAIDPLGYLYATWNLADEGKLSAALLDNFHVVVWNVGWAFPSVDADDRAALAAYLDNGGHLFISGQDIGWDIFDTGGSQYGTAAQNWYRTYLGATYVMDDTNLLTITGVGGDPIGDGMSFNIYGGTGANNQQYPSEIQPYGSGIGCLTYAATREAAVHLDSGTFQSVYLAFGFEGIATDAARELLMQRILQWFGVDVVGVPGEQAVKPFLASMPTASPNPFNPTTSIEFSVGGSQPAPTEVRIYDLRGHLVRTLWRGPVLPGEQSFVWNGRTDGGHQAASGVYLVRVNVGNEVTSFKTTMTK